MVRKYHGITGRGPVSGFDLELRHHLCKVRTFSRISRGFLQGFQFPLTSSNLLVGRLINCCELPLYVGGCSEKWGGGEENEMWENIMLGLL